MNKPGSVLAEILLFLLLASGTAAAGNSSTEQQNGLVAWWKFDAGSGPIARDASSNRNNGRVHGARWTKKGISGGAISFDGKGDYIEIPASASLDSIRSELTIIAWVKTDLSQRGTLLANWFYDRTKAPETNKRCYVCTIEAGGNAGRVNLGVSGEKTSGWIKSRGRIARGRWTHLAVICDGKQLAIYINGLLDSTAKGPPRIRAGGFPIYIGAWRARERSGPEWGTFFKGTIDELKLYTRALSAAEILRDYVAVAGSGTVAGTVTDGEGRELAGVRITCGPQSALTDESGNYRIKDLPAGVYVVKAFKPGYVVGLAERVEVRPGRSTALDFRIAAAGKIVFLATDGSGHYNCDGTNDEREMNAAVETLAAIGGGTVHLKAGRYTIDDAVRLESNITFEGEGQERTFIKLRDYNNREFWALFVLNKVSDVVVRDFTLDGNKRKQRVPKGIDSDIDGFDIYYSQRVQIERLTLQEFWTDGFEIVRSKDCTVRNCHIIQAGHDGFMTVYSERITIAGNFVHSRGTGNAGARLYECSHCLVENNHFDVYGFGILINPQGGVPCGGNVYRYNFMRGNYRDTPAIAIYARGTPIENETFIGNTIASSVWHGVRLYVTDDPQARIRNVKFLNCVINGSRASGIYFDGRTKDISGVLVKNCIISNNAGYGIYGKADSRYNNLWNNGKGNYAGGVKKGAGDISADPLFADPKNGDFHLKSEGGRWDPRLKRWVADKATSPCIDAADPNDDFSKEPEPNGSRINIGAYGNTKEASRTKPKERH